MTKTFRFAPSPNGFLHLGHAYSALLNGDLARASSGRMLLRIEDIDAARCRPEFEEAMIEDLRWLGLNWEEPVRRQSEHYDAYRDALARLDKAGLVYPSFESRADIAALIAERESNGGQWPRDPDGAALYPGSADSMSSSARTRLMQSGAPYALRLNMKAAISAAGPLTFREDGDGMRGIIDAKPDAWGDVILARKDTPTSYHLSVVVDDALQGVTDIVRGQDLFTATSVHRVLQTLLGLPEPRYRHHRLVLGADGRKLSKSDGASGLRELRAAGVLPKQIRERIGLLP